jgi:hypothetical protein
MAALPNELGENLADSIFSSKSGPVNATASTAASNNTMLNHLADLVLAPFSFNLFARCPKK